jgi:hypothetical protein
MKFLLIGHYRKKSAFRVFQVKGYATIIISSYDNPKEKAAVKPSVPNVSAIGIYLPEGHQPIIPVVSAANLSSK